MCLYCLVSLLISHPKKQVLLTQMAFTSSFERLALCLRCVAHIPRPKPAHEILKINYIVRAAAGIIRPMDSSSNVLLME